MNKSSRSKMSNVCPQCGSKFSEAVTFCDKCGYNIEKEKVLQEQKQKTNPNANSALNFKLQGYLQIIAVIEIAIGFVGLAMGTLIAIISPFVPDFIKSNPSENVVYSTSMLQLFTVLVLFMGVLILILSIVLILVGYKLYKLENIGRFGSMVVACFALLMVPFGTVFGVLSLFLLTKPETMELFKERSKYV